MKKNKKLRKKKADLKQIQKEAYDAIKSKAKEKIAMAKQWRVLLRLALEIIIVVSLAVWVLPQIDIIPFPINLIGFVFLMIVYLFVRFSK